MTQQGRATGVITGTALALTLLLGLLGGPGAARAEAGDFAPTGSMSVPRFHHTQSALQDGKALIVGGLGESCGFLCVETWDTAELYDPDAGTFSATGSLALGRSYQTATVLLDGRVLIAGGWPAMMPFGGATDTAEIYDPDTGQFSDTGSMNTPRKSHTASLLADGTVLITGGLNESNEPQPSAEVYDPETGTFTNTDSMTTPRYGQTASPLSSGKVLVAGGRSTGAIPTATAELYDPDSGTFSETGSMTTPRGLQTASLLADGRVLVAGGDTTALLPSPTETAEIYDPGTGGFSATGSMSVPRSAQTGTTLASGDVLIAGGEDPDAIPMQTAENYSPGAGTFIATGTMTTARRDAAASSLGDGKVLVTGGYGTELPQNTAELYDTPLPQVELSASALVFGDERISQSSAFGSTAATGSQSVTVTNSGTFVLHISRVEVTGADADAFNATGDCGGASLAPGSSCAVSVGFRPTSGGTKAATLRFTDNALDSPQRVDLSGTGIRAPTATPTATATPTPSRTPTPTPSSSPSSGTELTVRARAKAQRLKVGKQNRVVRSIRTNGKLKQLRVNCYFPEHKLTGKKQRSLCLTRSDKRRGVVEVEPLCSTQLRINVRIVAKATGQPRAAWKRSWRVEKRPRVVCSLNGNG